VLAYLSGTLKAKSISSGTVDLIIVEVAGVGFEVHVSRRTCLGAGQNGEPITLFTALSIRENDWTLFGFANQEERELFSLLQSVTGIGPKLALSLVGNFAPRQLAEAILNDDQKLITQCPGVGSKVAQRIVLELKSKIEDWHEKQFAGTSPLSAASQINEEVRSIMTGLGYTNTEINLALTTAIKEGIEDDVESLVKFSLKKLSSAASI
jgi:Holliday junction DNA helicase RuvA